MVAGHAFSSVNDKTLLLVPESMQFGHRLERIIREILLAPDSAFGLVKMLKMDLSNDFYRLHLVPSDAPKLGFQARFDLPLDPRLARPCCHPSRLHDGLEEQLLGIICTDGVGCGRV